MDLASVKFGFEGKIVGGGLFVLFVDLVSDDILQMAIGSHLLRKFGGRILCVLLTNGICCTLG